MDDEMLAAIKKNNGVVQIVAFNGYVKVQPAVRDSLARALSDEFFPGGVGRGGRGRAALPPDRQAEYDRRLAEIDAKYPPANVVDFVNHIDHAVKVAGIDHVGISSDFDGGGGVTGWRDASETFNVTLELVKRGYTEEQIAKLWGGNLLRVWAANQR
jgi:membrane dipeptidase